MATNVAGLHRQWLSEPGKKGQTRNDSLIRAVAVTAGASRYFWNVEQYEDQWQLIAKVLDA